MKGLIMERFKSLILVSGLILVLSLFPLLVRCPLAECSQNGGDLTDQNDVDTVIIALTRLDVNDLILDVNDHTLDVNDQTLELRYKIMNRSEHDIWICKDIKIYETGYDEEVYLDDDNKTLLIRRRLDVPTYVVWAFQPVSTYIRLRTGEDWNEILSLNLPVHSVRLFKPKLTESGVKYARRLVLDIGYHTKDLTREVWRWEPYPDPNTVEEVVVDYYDDSAKEGEHVLRITVNGVLIPYEEVMAEAINALEKVEDEP